MQRLKLIGGKIITKMLRDSPTTKNSIRQLSDFCEPEISYYGLVARIESMVRVHRLISSGIDVVLKNRDIKNYLESVQTLLSWGDQPLLVSQFGESEAVFEKYCDISRYFNNSK